MKLPNRKNKILCLFSLMFSLMLSHPAGALNTPQVGGQAPGFYRMRLGDFEVTALLDGFLPMPVTELLTASNPTEVKTLLDRSFQGSKVITSVNSFLINTGTHLVLVDTGVGSSMPGFNHLMENLKASGYQPEQVDEIYITHMHFDHVGGLIANGKAAFPNAVVRAHQNEAAFWLDPKNLAKENNPQMKMMFVNANAALKPYIEAGKFKTFTEAGELVPGISAVPLIGHTPGHTGYSVVSKNEKLFLLGDLLHVAAVQFTDPDAKMAYDGNAKNANSERKKIFEQAANGKYWIASAHLPFPGIGHVRKEMKGYAFVPANYEPVK